MLCLKQCSFYDDDDWDEWLLLGTSIPLPINFPKGSEPIIGGALWKISMYMYASNSTAVADLEIFKGGFHFES